MSWIPPLLALGFLAYAAWRDVATRTIPNAVCAMLAVLGLAVRAGEGWHALLLTLAAATALFLVLFACHARGLMGGGDVKLLTALSFGLPPSGSWDLVVATALAGGGLACLYLLLRRVPAAHLRLPARADAGTLRRILAVELRRVRQHGPMPYGVAIAIGGAFVLLQPSGG
jgi:prepilin peptidase CpaA